MVLNKRIQNAKIQQKKSTKCKVKYENMNNLKICGLYMCKCNVSMYFRNPFMNEYIGNTVYKTLIISQIFYFSIADFYNLALPVNVENLDKNKYNVTEN